MINVGVIGYGMSANIFHLPFIESNDNFTFTAISTRQKETVQAKYKKVRIFDSPDDLIHSGLVNLVVITAPNDVHYKIAKSCLENGLHVVIEKPMVTSTIQAEELIVLANKNNCLLSVYHNRRWDGDFLTVKKLLASNRLGELKVFQSCFDRFRPQVRTKWKEQAGEGTGILFDLGSHLIDQALTLFGLPTAITARCLALREKAKTTDYFDIQLHYANVEVKLSSSPFMAGPIKRFQLEGTLGSFIKFGLDPQEQQLNDGVGVNADEFAYDDEINDGTLYLGDHSEIVPTERGCYQAYYHSIANAINNRSLTDDSLVSATEAMQVIKLIELAQSSSDQGKTLSLPLNK